MTPSPGLWPTCLTPFTEQGEIDWHAVEALNEKYISSGSAGLFAVCLSSEAYALSDDEKIEITRRTVKQADGRVQVVAGALSLGSIEHLADHVNRVAEAGAQAVILNTSQLVASDAGDDDWRRAIDRVLQLTGSIPLGCYECPAPHHRLLSAEQLGYLAKTGRFVFHKDTSCDERQIADKLEAIQGTPLRFYNAHTPSLGMSLAAGGDGYSGVGSNLFPRLYAIVCSEARRSPERVAPVLSMLCEADASIIDPYPVSGKVALQMQGVPILPVCRDSKELLTDEHKEKLSSFFDRAAVLERSFHDSIPSPHFHTHTPTDSDAPQKEISDRTLAR